MSNTIMSNVITRPDVQFIMTIGAVIVSITFGYSAIATRLAVMETKQEQILTLLQTHEKNSDQATTQINDKLTRLTANQNELNKDVIALKAVYLAK